VKVVRKASRIMSWQTERRKFDDFDLDLSNAKHRAEEMQFEVTKEGTTENLAAATAADEAHANVCREFRRWCVRMEGVIPARLNDAATELSSSDRTAWLALLDDVTKRLPALEAACPTADDPQPPPRRKARRWQL
jgi:hypothetical protein